MEKSDLSLEPGLCRELIESALTGVYLIQERRFVYVNEALAHLFAYRSAADVVGREVMSLVAPEDRPRVRDKLQRRLTGDLDSVRYRFAGLRADGQRVYVEARGFAVRYRGAPAVLGNLLDYTDRLAYERRIRELAFFDSLTGLPNRRFLAFQARRELSLVRRHGRILSLLYLDLDGFKQVNDTWGHRAGDELLSQVGRSLRGCLRASDTLARLSGDEFALLLPETAAGEARAVAQKVLEALAAPVRVAGQELRIGASVGLVSAPDHGASLEDLLRHADIAMYQAKDRGGGLVCFEPPHADRAQARTRLAQELRRALEAGELELRFQPRVELASGEPVAAEGLPFWVRGDGEPDLEPAELMALAGQCGLAEVLGQWLLDQAVRQAARWRAAGRDQPVALRLPDQELIREELPARCREALDRHGLAASRLELEFSQGAAQAELASGAPRLRQLRDLGVPVRLGGFGSGGCCLAGLPELPLAGLKLDRCLVAGLEAAGGGGRAAVARALLKLAGELGLPCVAEGLRTTGERDALLALGCRHGQGELFSPGLSSDALDEWLGACGRH